MDEDFLPVRMAPKIWSSVYCRGGGVCPPPPPTGIALGFVTQNGKLIKVKQLSPRKAEVDMPWGVCVFLPGAPTYMSLPERFIPVGVPLPIPLALTFSLGQQ